MKRLFSFLLTAFSFSAAFWAYQAFAAAASESERAAAVTEANRSLRAAAADMKDFMHQPGFRAEEETGVSWLDKGESDREDAIVHAMATLSEYGVVFGQRPERYTALVRDTLAAYPERAYKRLVDILGGIIYDTEAENRGALEKITLKRS